MKLCHKLLKKICKLKLNCFMNNSTMQRVNKYYIIGIPTTYCTRWFKVILIIIFVLWIVEYIGNKCIMHMYL